MITSLERPSNKTYGIPGQVAVVGGGRWGRILSSILAGFDEIEKVVIISNRNFVGVNHWLERTNSISPTNKKKIVTIRALEKILSDKKIPTAIVANLPFEHYRTTERLLIAGKHVLVEKPFTETFLEAQHLIELSEKVNCVLGVGLEFHYSQGVIDLANSLAGQSQNIDGIQICWEDIYTEKRHSEVKTPDSTINVFVDLFPHVYTMLRVLLGDERLKIKSLIQNHSNKCQIVRLQCGGALVTIRFSRDAREPNRYITIQTKSGENFTLDFTKDPNTLNIASGKCSKQFVVENNNGSLSLELLAFLGETTNQRNEAEVLAYKHRQLFEIMELAKKMINEDNLVRLEKTFLEESPALTNEIRAIISENLLSGFLKIGLVDTTKNEERISLWIRKAFRLVHLLSSDAFISQSEICRDLGIAKEMLIKLNTVIRESELCQALILKHGHAEKYWVNTIVPLTKTNYLQKASSGDYCYPHRVSVYPGLSCMFACSFCGREKENNSKYLHQDMLSGNTMFKRMFQEAPKDDPYRFYISGGLEPLTNSGIGELISIGAENGFQLTMYTNGFALKPSLIDRQPGLWALDTIRISIYGTNRASTLEVTKHKRAYEVVRKNIVDFLRLREERNQSTKIGINYVLLPGHESDVLELIDMVAEVHQEASTDCGIDFLTLREDFSNEPLEIERDRNLVATFEQLEQKLSEDIYRNLHVDIGYALHSFSKNSFSGPKLHRVLEENMRPKGFTQLCVSLDLLGSVYLYREAAFLNRPGSQRYIIGKVSEDNNLESIIKNFLNSDKTIVPESGDTKFFDAYDHIVTSLLNLIDKDKEFGIPFEKGPVKLRISDQKHSGAVLSPSEGFQTVNPSHFSSVNLAGRS